MNLKYKKMIFLLTTGIMGIGMVNLSFMQQDKTKSVDAIPPNQAVASYNPMDEGDNSSNTTPTVSLEPTVTPKPANDLELNKYAEINEVITEFYQAKLVCDEEKFKQILLNADQLDMERLQRKIEYIQDYHNINCYTKKGINEIDYVVYIIYDIELTTIETYSPSIDELLITYVDGAPKIYMGDISKETSGYLSKLRNKEDVQLLVSDVETRLKEACELDEDLNEFYKNITKSSSSETSGETTSEGDINN